MKTNERGARLILALQPKNPYTNFMIAGALIAVGELFEERDFTALKEHGNVYPRWECPYNIVAALVKARKSAEGINFKIWIKKGPERFKDGEFLFRKRPPDKKVKIPA